ncbi:MAG: hypothetical protein HS111_21575 [Kofleriaceae bacterium]|nr:hypothetical protein [Kofleriaceae bacterium]
MPLAAHRVEAGCWPASCACSRSRSSTRSLRIVKHHPRLAGLPHTPRPTGFAPRRKLAGVTERFVDAGVDTGPIIAQRAVPSVRPGDDAATLHARIQVEEHQLLPAVRARWPRAGSRCEGRTVAIAPARWAPATPLMPTNSCRSDRHRRRPRGRRAARGADLRARRGLRAGRHPRRGPAAAASPGPVQAAGRAWGPAALRVGGGSGAARVIRELGLDHALKRACAVRPPPSSSRPADVRLDLSADAAACARELERERAGGGPPPP